MFGKRNSCDLEGSMTRAWEIVAPMSWNASEDPGGPSSKAGEFSALPGFNFQNVLVRNPYFQANLCLLICLAGVLLLLFLPNLWY